MHVTHVIKVVAVAGAERHLLILLPALRARGVDADLLVLAEPGNPMDDMLAAAEKAALPVQREFIPRDVSPGLLLRLAQRFRAERPDVVHTHLFHADLYGLIAARWAGVPRVVSSRHNDDSFRRLAPVRWLNRWLWRQFDGGIAISEHVRRFCLTTEGAPPGKLTTIPYGLNGASLRVGKGARTVICNELGLPPDALLVGMVCRLIEQKGVVYGLQAFWRVSARFPQAHLLIAGEGPLRGELERQAISYRLGDRVHFLGWRDDARAIIAALDVLLAPSLWEGFGLNLLEAMALGTPVLASSVSAIPEIILDGETGLLAPPRDVDHLTSSLLLLLADAPLRRQLAEAAARRQETVFSVEQMADRTLAFYRQLV